MLSRKAQIIRLTFALEGGLLLLALILGWIFNVSPFAKLTVEPWAWLWGLVLTLPPLIAVALASHYGRGAVRRLFRLVEDKLIPLLRGASLLELAVISTLAGLGEEVLFRGFVQPALASTVPPLVALLIASVLFGLAHFVTRTYAAFATLFGIYLGGLMLFLDNLLVPIVVHALYDFIVLAYMLSRHRR